MRIGIDLRTLEGGSAHRGIGRYTREVVAGLSRLDHDDELVLLTSAEGDAAAAVALDAGARTSVVAAPPSRLRHRRGFRLVFLAPRPLAVDDLGLDVVLQPDPHQPIDASTTPRVTVVHDLIPLLFARQYRTPVPRPPTARQLVYWVRHRAIGARQRRDLRRLGRADRLLAVSSHTRDDVLARSPRVRADHVVVIPLAATPPADAPDPGRLPGHGLDDGAPLLLYVGGTDPRKGVLRLVAAMEQVWARHPDARLALAGSELDDRERTDTRDILAAVARSARPERIAVVGRVSDAELAWLYATASAFAFPSSYEGFGLPVLEAMQAGCPVVAHRNSSLPEVAGDAAVLVPDGTSLAGPLADLLDDPARRSDLAVRGRERAAGFTWDRTAERTLAVLREVATEERRSGSR